MEFVDALFSFLTSLIMSQSGGNLIIGAGVIPALISFISITRPAQIKARFDIIIG
jgi:E3 ubiquitin-protein ligase HUWE1